jgi:putative methyltransferase (TIGR04325 family)
MASTAPGTARLGKYFQPLRYVRRLQSLTAALSPPITDYGAEALTELVYQKTVRFNRTTLLDLGMGSERLLLAVGIALREKSRDENTHVLDFGGACGIHYKLATLLFPDSRFRWAVVETSAMVKRAKSLETGSLKFFRDIGSATDWLGEVELVNSNSALQYVANPLQTVRELLELRPKVALWERLMLSNDQTCPDRQRSMLFDHGPGAVPAGFRNRAVVQDITRLSRADFLSSHGAKYKLRCTAEDAGDLSTFLFSRCES